MGRPSKLESQFNLTETPMIHLAISCSSYLLFFLVKALTPTQPASWRLQEQTHRLHTTR